MEYEGGEGGVLGSCQKTISEAEYRSVEDRSVTGSVDADFAGQSQKEQSTYRSNHP